MWWQWLLFVGIGIAIGVIGAKIAGDDSHGCLFDMLIGILGAVIGGALFWLLIKGTFALVGLIGAVIFGIAFVLCLKLYVHFRRWRRGRHGATTNSR